MIRLLVVIAAFSFHAYWKVEDDAQKMTQTQLFWRNVITLGAALALLGLSATLGPALRLPSPHRCSSSDERFAPLAA